MELVKLIKPPYSDSRQVVGHGWTGLWCLAWLAESYKAPCCE